MCLKKPLLADLSMLDKHQTLIFFGKLSSGSSSFIGSPCFLQTTLSSPLFFLFKPCCFFFLSHCMAVECNKDHLKILSKVGFPMLGMDFDRIKQEKRNLSHIV